MFQSCESIFESDRFTVHRVTILATPVQLNEKIRKMKDRVRSLEVALRQAHSRISPIIHPLLFTSDYDVEQTPDISKLPPETEGNLDVAAPHSDDKGSSQETSSTDNLSSAFGTLSITPGRGLKVSAKVRVIGSIMTDSGHQWYGKTAASENFLEVVPSPYFARGLCLMTFCR